MSNRKPICTVINHETRREAGLSFMEYAVLEAISHLSNQPKFPWCKTSRQSMADFFDLSKRGLQKIIKRLEESGFIERNANDELKATQKWYDLIATKEDGGEQSSRGGEQSSRGGEQSSHNHSTYQNNNQNPPIFPPAGGIEESSQSETREEGRPRRKIDIYISRYNELFDAKTIATDGRIKKLNTRLKTFTFEQIMTALENLSLSSWHKGNNENNWIAKPDFLLRSDEKVDEWLQYKPTSQQYSPLTELEVWKLAVDMDIAVPYVEQVHKNIASLIEKNDFHKYARGRPTEEVLRDWLQRDLSMKKIDKANEIEKLDYDRLHPLNKRLSKRSLYRLNIQEYAKRYRAMKEKLEQDPDNQKIKAELEKIKTNGSLIKQHLLAIEEEIKQYGPPENK
jgi:predicted DNA-binding protein YlxM (UPF0122 family)